MPKTLVYQFCEASAHINIKLLPGKHGGIVGDLIQFDHKNWGI